VQSDAEIRMAARRRRQRTSSLVHQTAGTLRDKRWLPVVERSISGAEQALPAQ
jgi:hypothetical protein